MLVQFTRVAPSGSDRDTTQKYITVDILLSTTLPIL